MTNPLNPNNPESSNTTETMLATYGILLAVILTIASLVVGFNKTNIFAALAFVPMIAYFLHEFGHKIFPSKDEGSNTPLKISSLSTFLLQDSPLLRVSLSLLIVAIIASLAKANIAPTPQSGLSANTDIVSPLSDN